MKTILFNPKRFTYCNKAFTHKFVIKASDLKQVELDKNESVDVQMWTTPRNWFVKSAVIKPVKPFKVSIAVSFKGENFDIAILKATSTNASKSSVPGIVGVEVGKMIATISPAKDVSLADLKEGELEVFFELVDLDSIR